MWSGTTSTRRSIRRRIDRRLSLYLRKASTKWFPHVRECFAYIHLPSWLAAGARFAAPAVYGAGVPKRPPATRGLAPNARQRRARIAVRFRQVARRTYMCVKVGPCQEVLGDRQRRRNSGCPIAAPGPQTTPGDRWRNRGSQIRLRPGTFRHLGEITDRSMGEVRPTGCFRWSWTAHRSPLR